MRTGRRKSARAVSPPSLTAFGWRELQRALAIALLGTVAVVIGARPPALADRARPRRHMDRGDLRRIVDAFMVLGPTFVKLGQMVASSPSVFPKPLADAWPALPR